MTTRAPSMLVDTAHDWEDMFSSTVFSGIVGDINHPDGYHISYEDNSKSNYSTTRPPDKPPKMPSSNEEMASAIDMSMAKSDMVTHYNRIIKVFNDPSDPRRKYFNAVNCWDGKSANAVRLDLYAGTKSTATNDHKSHVHDEYARMYCQDKKAGRAHLSVWSGQSKADWIEQEEEVSLTTDQTRDAVWRRDNAIDNKFPWREDSPEHDPPGNNPKVQGQTGIHEAARRANLAYLEALEAKSLGVENQALLNQILNILQSGVPIPGAVNLTPEAVQAVATATINELDNRI